MWVRISPILSLSILSPKQCPGLTLSFRAGGHLPPQSPHSLLYRRHLPRRAVGVLFPCSVCPGHRVARPQRSVGDPAGL